MANSPPAPPPSPPPPESTSPSDLGKLCEARCKKYACAIQYCLERNQYQESRCWKEVGGWNMCCERVKEREAQRWNVETEPPEGGDK